MQDDVPLVVEHADLHRARVEIDARWRIAAVHDTTPSWPACWCVTVSLVADNASAQMPPSLELVTGLWDSVASMQEAMMSIYARQRTRYKVGPVGNPKIASR